MIFFFVGPLIQLVRAILSENSFIITTALLLLGFGLIFAVFIRIYKKHLEIFMTVFVGFFYLFTMIQSYHGNAQLFNHPNNTFFFGYTMCIFEFAIINRIPKLSYRTVTSIVLLLARAFVIPIHNKANLPMHIFALLFSIYLDWDRDKKDQKLFGSYFYSQKQLSRFKDLVANHIPDGMVILAKDFNQCLFANNSFRELTEDQCKHNFGSCLERFFIEEVALDPSIGTESNLSCYTSANKQTLLAFLNTYRQSSSDTGEFKYPSDKPLCNVSYMKNLKIDMDESQNNSFRELLNQTELSFEVKVLSLIWEEKPAIGIIFHDITQQNTILRLKIAANIQKDRLLATVSHELRTPLNSILGMIQIMLQITKDMDLMYYLKICSNSGHLLLGLINSILDMNLIRANKLKLYTEQMELREFLQDIMRLFEFQCSQKSIFLRLNMSLNTPKTVVTDKNRLSQIFINLIGNALKFTQHGGITISVSRCFANKDYVEMSVEDTGLGIKEEDKDKLFKMFGKLENERGGTIVNTQGVGLGLTISNNLAKLLCDKRELEGIKVESEYRKGSKFTFIIKTNLEPLPSPLPIIPVVLDISCNLTTEYLDEGTTDEKSISEYQSSPIRKKYALEVNNNRKNLTVKTALLSSTRIIDRISRKVSTSSPVHSSPCVLIVDDNPLNLKVVEHFVKRQLLSTKSALYGQVAIDMMLKNDHQRCPIVLILMDLQMPVMDGYQTTKALRKLMESRKIPAVPIVALTANGTEADKKACLEAGMSDHLTKPLKESELVRILKKFN